MLIKNWGAVPVPYDWAQLYQGLQTGVVSGQYVATPISGFLVCVAAVASVVEDSYKIRSGTYQEDRETDTSVT